MPIWSDIHWVSFPRCTVGTLLHLMALGRPPPIVLLSWWSGLGTSFSVPRAEPTTRRNQCFFSSRFGYDLKDILYSFCCINPKLGNEIQREWKNKMKKKLMSVGSHTDIDIVATFPGELSAAVPQQCCPLCAPLLEAQQMTHCCWIPSEENCKRWWYIIN